MDARREQTALDAGAARRVRRELRTIRVMIGMSCRAHHGTRGALCDACQGLWEYASARVDHCPFRQDKPTCVNCPVHCYRADRREQVRQVMRYAGPRMIWRHPWLAVLHLIDGRRPAPSQRPRQARTEAGGAP